METARLVVEIVLVLAVLATGAAIVIAMLYTARKVQTLTEALPEFGDELNKMNEQLKQTVAEFADQAQEANAEYHDEHQKSIKSFTEALEVQAKKLEITQVSLEEIKRFAAGLPKAALIAIKVVEGLRQDIIAFQAAILAAQPKGRRRDSETFQPPDETAEAAAASGGTTTDMINQMAELAGEDVPAIRTAV